MSKTFPIDKIHPLIDHGHSDFGENKVQESVDKWSGIKSKTKILNFTSLANSKEIKLNVCKNF